ncbi:hypothetical protein [Pandoraea pneumonica]
MTYEQPRHKLFVETAELLRLVYYHAKVVAFWCTPIAPEFYERLA